MPFSTRIFFYKYIYRNILYRSADKSLTRPGRKQAQTLARDMNDFNIETRVVIKYFFPTRQGAEGNSHNSGRNVSLFPSWSGKGLISTHVLLSILKNPRMLIFSFDKNWSRKISVLGIWNSLSPDILFCRFFTLIPFNHIKQQGTKWTYNRNFRPRIKFQYLWIFLLLKWKDSSFPLLFFVKPYKPEKH